MSFYELNQLLFILCYYLINISKLFGRNFPELMKKYAKLDDNAFVALK